MDKELERIEELEEAPVGMFPEDDEDVFEIDIDEDLDVWNRGSGYTFGGGGWWTGGVGSHTALSSMWSTSTYDHHSTAQRLLKHKNHIDSLCKVVDPTVKHTLEFAAANGSGYTDMTRGHIVIDGKIIQDNDSKLDVVSGLAIHEKLHVIHSKSLHRWQKSDEVKYDLCNNYTEEKLFHSIANIVEDEYIERQLHKTCAGYVHYIEACKEHYFAESGVADVDLNDFTEIVNTLLLLVRYPAKLDADRRKKHGKHIRIFMAELKKGIDSREHTKACITNIFKYLIKVAEDMSDDKGITDDMIKDMEAKGKAYADNYIDEFKRDVSKAAWDEMVADGKIDGIHADIAKRRTKNLMREAEAEMIDNLGRLFGREFRDKLSKVTDYKSAELSSRMANQIKELADSGYTEEMIDEALAVSDGQRKVSWEKATSNEHAIKKYKSAKIEMKSQINKLKKKIQLYGNTNIHNIYRQPRGILDKRQLHRIPMGMTDLFKAKITKEDKPLDICLLVDESGSMGYKLMDDARNAAIAIKEALADNPMIDLWVYGHSADNREQGQTEMIEYHSPSMKDRPFAMGGLHARYENRDGNAIITSALRVNSESDNATNKLMIVLSDGEPSADLYRGMRGIDHTAKAVKFVESRGWNVIQVGFGGISKYSMEKMFSNWVHVEDTDELGDKVSKIIRKVVKV